jgi:uncharacterized protein (UPF0212 family)
MNGQLSCPKCGKPMEEGFVVDRAHGNIKSVPTWIAGKPEPSFWLGLKTGNRDNIQVQTLRCPACGFLESYATK